MTMTNELFEELTRITKSVEPTSDEAMQKIVALSTIHSIEPQFLALVASLVNERQAALDNYQMMVNAWEALPGGRDYRLREVEKWCAEDLKPAIDHLRKLLRKPT